MCSASDACSRSGPGPVSGPAPPAAHTHINVSLLVSQVQVVHDGAVVEVLQRGHVLHAPDAAEAHGLHLLPRQRILLVCVHLPQGTKVRGQRWGQSSES